MSQDGRESDWVAEPAPPWDEYGWPAAGQPDRYGAAGQSAADLWGSQPDPYRNGPGQYGTDTGFSAGPQHSGGGGRYEPAGAYGPPDPYGPPDSYGPADRYGLPDSYGPADSYGPPESAGPADSYGPPESAGPADLSGGADPYGRSAGRRTPVSYRHRRPGEPADSYPAPRPYVGTDSSPGSNGPGPGYRPGSHARGRDQNGASGQYRPADQDGRPGQQGQPGQYPPAGQYGQPDHYGPADGYTALGRPRSPLDGPQGSNGSGSAAGYRDHGRYDLPDQHRAAGPYSSPGGYREPDPAAQTQAYAIPERAWSPDPLSDSPQERTDPYDDRAAGPPWSPQAEPSGPPADGRREVPGPDSYPGRAQWPASGYGSPDVALPPAADGPFRWQPLPGQPGPILAEPDQDNTSRRPWEPGSAVHAGDMGDDREGGRHGRSRGGRRTARDQDYPQDGSLDGGQPGRHDDDETGYWEQLPGGRAAQPAGGFRGGQPDRYPAERAAGYPQHADDYPHADGYPQQDDEYAGHGRRGHLARRGSRGREAGPAMAGEGGAAGGFFSEFGGDGKAAKPKRGRGWIAAVLALVVIVAAGSGAAYAAWKWWQGRHGNYAGPGTGQVVVRVQPGEYPAQLAPTLVRLGVIKTTQPFIDAAKQNDPTGLEPGYFRLHKHMNAALAWALLLSPKSRVQTVVTIPDGLRASSIIAMLAKKTGIPLASYQQALKETGALGLPAYANGNVEGYLYPATYDLPPNATALSVLRMMVAQFNSEASSLDLAAAARHAQLTEAQVITEASLLEAEVNRVSYYPMVAKVIDNRLNDGMMLGLDSTVAYAVNKYIYDLSSSDLAVNSPYNTFKHKGLPPGPIDSPDAAAISAVLHPAPGDWTYFVTVNPKTGQTDFTNSYAQFQVWSQEASKNGA